MNKRVNTLSGAQHKENPCPKAGVLFVRGLGYALLMVISAVSLSLYACKGEKNNPDVKPEDSVNAIFANTFSSVKELSEKVVDLVEKQDQAGLETLRVNEEEFKRYIWPEMPASGGSSECGQVCDYAWKDLNQKSDWHLKQTLVRFGGKKFSLGEVMFDGETTEYRTFKIHRYPVFLLREEQAEEKKIRLMGSVIEKDDQFKLLSYVIRD